MSKAMAKRKLSGIIVLGAGVLTIILAGCSGADSTPAVSNTNTVTTQTVSPGQTQTSINMPQKTTKQQSTAVGKLSVAIGKAQVNPGDTFTVEVLIDSEAVTRGAQCALSFDASAMECTGVQEGNFFKDWADANGATTAIIPSEPAIDNFGGTVETVGIALMGGVDGKVIGPQGSGVLFSYTMAARSDVNKKAGITLSDVAVSDENADDFSKVDTVNGEVIIGTP